MLESVKLKAMTEALNINLFFIIYSLR